MATGGLFANRGMNQGRAFAAYRAKAARWEPEQEALFCDALANGASIAAASILAGKSKGAGSSKLRKIERKLGWQAA